MRSLLYFRARLLGDLSAVQKGKAGQRSGTARGGN